MSELTVTLLRLGYLALLWVFVFAAIGVLRKDIYGTRITARATRSRRPAPVGAAGVQQAPSASVPKHLVVTQGQLTGTTLPLGSSAILIGRAPSCTLVLDDDYSSTRHARIFPQGESWIIEDLDSTNGSTLR